ncbi:hypothetical protein FSST1_010428 [Fusarium sambucinum]
MTSIFASVNWKGCFGKYTSPYSLYRYKECSTPKDYIGQHNIQAFKLSYDRESNTTSLQHKQETRDGTALDFSNTAIPPEEAEVDTTIGWYFDQHGLANFYWGDLKSGTENEVERKLEKKEKFRWIREKEGHLFGINRLWVIRGYFIGPNENKAPPCITVLCAYEDVARFLVDRIHDKLHLHEGWVATRLPGVEVLTFGSNPGSDYESDSSDYVDKSVVFAEDPFGETMVEAENHLIRIEIDSPDNHTMPTMTDGHVSSWALKRHRCGITVEIVRGTEVIAKATIGGLITIGGEIYGLTVGHLFSPSATRDAGELQSLSPETISNMNAWQEGRACGMEFDWALVKIPSLQNQDVESWMDVNLVQTVSGEFRPVFIALEEPPLFIHVVIATPGSTRCLRGVLVGPGAFVNIPGSPIPYATWVCRMELPWLIQPGDSGSWAFDAQNGMMLGVLVAGCPELQEAYIIPAHEIVEDIERHYSDNSGDPKMSVHLPNCLSRSLQRQIYEYVSIVKSAENLVSLRDLEQLDSRIRRWWTGNNDKFAYVPSSSDHSDCRTSPWRSALSVLQYDKLENKRKPGYTKSNSNDYRFFVRTAIRRSPLQCYNLMNEKFAAHRHPYDIVMLPRMWRCLMLGLSNYSSNDSGIPRTTKSAYERIIKEEVRLMTYSSSSDYPRFRSSWEKNLITYSPGRRSGLFPWYKHAFASTLRVFELTYSLNTSRKLYPLSRDYLSSNKALRDTGWPPWDRLAPRTVLDRLSDDLWNLIHIQRIGVAISLPETKNMLGKFEFVGMLHEIALNAWITGSPLASKNLDNDMVLFSAKIIDMDNKFLVTLPQPVSRLWRLPFIVTYRSVPEEENLNLLLTTQHIDIGAFQRRRKLNLRDEHSRFYLEEHNQYVDVVIYEGHIGDYCSAWEKDSQRDWWTIPMVNQPEGNKYLMPPFSAILDLQG